MDEDITPNSCNYVFTTDDCMGYKVVLKEETYIYKIKEKHPDVPPDLIKNGVESAHYVVQDPDHANRRRYYKIIPSPIEGRNDMKNLKVVVETTSNEYDEVVTAYMPKNLKGEEIISGGILYDSSVRRVR